MAPTTGSSASKMSRPSRVTRGSQGSLQRCLRPTTISHPKSRQFHGPRSLAHGSDAKVVRNHQKTWTI